MSFLINPNLAYILVVLGVTLFLLTNIYAKTTALKIGMTVFLIAAGLEFVYLPANLWAFLIVALSPIPFIIGVRCGKPQNPLFLLSIFMLTIASIFLFIDQDGQQLVSNRWAWVSVLSAAILWISTERLRNVEGVRLNNDPDSVIGLIGEAKTDIEAHSAGSVLVEGEVWQARSKEPIRAGSLVRVLRQDGFWLTVKEVDKISKR